MNNDVGYKPGGSCNSKSCGKNVKGSLDFLNPENLLEETENTVTSSEGYIAPEFTGLTDWMNTDSSLSLEELRGNVVLVKFWTLGCINCINTHKNTNALYEKYKDQGLEIIGIHAPEFAYERKVQNVQKSIEEHAIKYPVALDNDFASWKMYNNRFWPAFYLIDREGKVRYTHFGEGKYEQKEQAVIELLQESSMLEGKSNTPELLQKEDIVKPVEEFLFKENNLRTNTAQSSIPLKEILDGGSGKDGIPAINTPKFITQKQAEKSSAYLGKDDLGIVLVRSDEARFYGYDVLVWHEIVNDTIDGEKVAVTFCPLCGSAIVYDRSDVNGREVTFGVSGKLYKSNLLMYDSHDESLWSQSFGEAVVGNQLATKLKVVKSELMSYKEFQDNFPNGLVLSNDTGYNRRYGEIPYGNYNTNENLYFPVSSDIDSSFHPKKLFYIVNHKGDSLAFAWDELREEKKAVLAVEDKEYSAKFSNGLVDVEFDGEILPGYFEMWFSWVSHNEGNKNIWFK